MANIYMHINYFAKHYPIETGFQKAAEYGYDGLELRVPEEDLSTGLLEIKTLKERYNIKGIVFTMPTNVIQDDENAWQRNVDSFKDTLKAIHGAFGRGIIVNTCAGQIPEGSRAARDEHYHRAATAFLEIGSHAEQLDMKVAIEMRMNQIHDTATSTLKLLNMIESPAVMATFDYGNIYSTLHGEKPEGSSVDIIKGHIGYLHVKNYKVSALVLDGVESDPRVRGDSKARGVQVRFLTLLGEGDIDHFHLLRLIYDTGYNGPICAEHPWPGDPHYAAKQDLLYLREVTNSIGWY